MLKHRNRLIAATGAVVTAGAIATAGMSAAQAAPASVAAAKGTVITVVTTVYGKALVVGSGPFAGFSLYSITSDHGRHFGCTAVPVKTPVGTLLCTGPSNSHQAEWPAITTIGKPVAGPGVNPALLGTVTRKNVGTQVTYAGHPLYLFDRQPGAVTGESWDEPGLPPWNGVWTLVKPSGKALPSAGTLTTAIIKGKKVLAAQMNTGIGTINFPVYSYSKDTPAHSACAVGACARAWPLMLTSGTPGVWVACRPAMSLPCAPPRAPRSATRGIRCTSSPSSNPHSHGLRTGRQRQQRDRGWWDVPPGQAVAGQVAADSC